MRGGGLLALLRRLPGAGLAATGCACGQVLALAPAAQPAVTWWQVRRGGATSATPAAHTLGTQPKQQRPPKQQQPPAGGGGPPPAPAAEQQAAEQQAALAALAGSYQRSRLGTFYDAHLARALLLKLDVRNAQQLPRVDSVDLSISAKDVGGRRYAEKWEMLLPALALEYITGRPASFVTSGVKYYRSRNAVTAVKVRLVGGEALDLLQKLAYLVLPSQSAFAGIPARSLDRGGNLHFRLAKIINFPDFEEQFEIFESLGALHRRGERRGCCAGPRWAQRTPARPGMGAGRRLLLVGVVAGVARLCGFSVLEWLTAVAGLAASAASQVLLGSSEPRDSTLPPLHQAIRNVTQDAMRVADLLDAFFEAEGDAGARGRFMAFLAAQANTSYTAVDNQLSWVLYLYSMVWMPLLVVMCFARASRSTRPSGARAPRGAPLQPTASAPPGCVRPASVAGGGAGGGAAHALGGGGLEAGGIVRSASLAAETGSMRSASVRSLRRSATAAPARQNSLQLQARPSTDSLRGVPAGSLAGGSVRSMASSLRERGAVHRLASGDGCDGSERGSLNGSSLRNLRAGMRARQELAQL
ncbi:RPL5 [Scenedesmus sp. PABB004]|nr:RPL5 [Scenedesmus sp. PABB004]